MTDNKRVTNKQIIEELERFRKALSKTAVNFKFCEEDLNVLATKTVSRMVKLKAMEDWFDHVNESDIAWSTSYKDLKLTEEENALGEAAKLMTLMEMFKQNEEYEKCAIVRNRMDEVNKILRKFK